jgi:plasmid stability protein
MRMTITIRTDEALRDALERRAAAEGRSLSDVARDILRDGLVERPFGDRVGHLRGRLQLRRGAEEPWRSALRSHNWRP